MKVKLEEVCKRIYAGGDVPKDRYSEEKTEYYKVPIFANAEKDEGLYGYTDEAREKELSITVAARGTIGYTVIRREPFLPVVRLITVVPDLEKVSERYLFYALKMCKPQSSGTSIPQLTVPDIKRNTLNLLDIAEQESIANILDKLKGIIKLRTEVIFKLDELIRARFVEMFGDLKNTIRLGDCCKVHARIGWQALTRDEHMKTGEYMLVTGTDFIDGKINYNTCVYVTRERYEMDPHIILRENDILITKDGSIGKVAIIHNLSKPATLNSGVFVVRPKDIFNKEYISGVFRGPLFEKFIELSKTGATIKHLNQKHLVEFRIPLPTLEKQEVFARFSNQINKSKVEVQRALDEAQLLFDSLMQKYFG
ncbi:type I restriction modification DNA specificity domain protein [Lachnoanaerobaculum sp. ICM7]|uniref:restriction endonuclease subunit S n=1 Tax=Lachnoanaerobaculum sp. ICM7 TaxID=936594 RepID=UPI00027A3E55|nr:restriction endonuclease subunit S [Lachnoanaerobaculum sp. ICM7]EJP19793.1 type I restriction modification DNA specificity domain protein [Lachnoanaerobaculum sp. ICM7]